MKTIRNLLCLLMVCIGMSRCAVYGTTDECYVTDRTYTHRVYTNLGNVYATPTTVVVHQHRPMVVHQHRPMVVHQHRRKPVKVVHKHHSKPAPQPRVSRPHSRPNNKR